MWCRSALENPIGIETYSDYDYWWNYSDVAAHWKTQ